MYECPVCRTPCDANTTKCNICPFFDDLGIARAVLSIEEARHRIKTIIAPCRNEWEKIKKISLILSKIGDANLPAGRLNEQNQSCGQTRFQKASIMNKTDSDNISIRDLKLLIGSKQIICGQEWRILDVENHLILLLSEKLFERKPISGAPWIDSTLRSYLNNDLYSQFNGKLKIFEKKIMTYDNPWYPTNSGNVSTERIFLLSIEEVVKYFGDSNGLSNRNSWVWRNRKYVCCENDESSNGNWINDEFNLSRKAHYKKGGRASWWWLRSPGSTRSSFAFINSDGTICISGRDIVATPEGGGVRPALWIDVRDELRGGK